MRCGTCGLVNANCSGDTVMQTFVRNGTVPLATFDNGAAAGCGACSYLKFDPPPVAAGRRKVLTSAAVYMIDVEVACAGGGFGCAWSFQYEFVYPPPPPAPPSPLGPPLIRCMPVELPLGDYNVSLAQQAQALLVAQLRAYAQSPLVVRPVDGVVALLWVDSQNVTSVLSFLSSVVDTSFFANVRWWDQCLQRNAVATIAITSLDQVPLSVNSPEGVSALISVLHSAVTLSEVPPFLSTQSDALVALDAAASSGQALVPDAGQCLTSALSDIVAFALTTNNYALLAGIPPILEHAATSQSLQLAHAVQQHEITSAIATTSPYIQTVVQADPRLSVPVASAAAPLHWGVPAEKRIEPTSCLCNGCEYAKQHTRSVSWFNLSTLETDNGTLPYLAQYFALDFDPYAAQYGFRFVLDGSASSTLYNSTGVSRLQLVDASTLQPVKLTNLPRPIAFEMPQVLATGGVADAQGRCGFWDSNFTVYDTTGTATLPDPRPEEHDLSFADAPLTPDNAALALAWNITGPLLENCTLAFLDCTAPPFERLRIQWGGVWSEYPHNLVYLDPWHPLDFPAVACPDAAADSNQLSGGNVSAALLTRMGGQPLLRIYYGFNCDIWKVNNRVNCTWDAAKQAFFGGGCISGAVDERTQCLTRHLTEFVSARVPQISVCSASDMTSLNPADIWNKLRMLFYVVLALFLTMNIGALAGYFIDAAERRSVLSRLRSTRVGFSELPNGLWTWTCVQKQLTQDVQTPTGSAWELCSIFGLPFVRLRAALPEEFFVGSVGQAVGRRVNLSLRGLAETKEHNIEAMRQMMRDLNGCCAAPRAPMQRIPGLEDVDSPTHVMRDMETQAYGLKRDVAATETVVRAPQQHKHPRRPNSPHLRAVQREAETDGARFVGTALVLAFLAKANVMPSVELKRFRDVATAHFAGVMLRGTDHSFARLVALFTILLSPGNLSSESSWLIKARMWRLIFLQRADGGWDLTESLAFAIEAHAGVRHKTPVGKVLRTVRAALRFVLPFLLELDEELEEESEFDDGTSDVSSKRSSKTAKTAKSAKGVTSSPAVDDCPLTFSASAIAASIPPELLALNKVKQGHRRKDGEPAAAAQHAARGVSADSVSRLQLLSHAAAPERSGSRLSRDSDDRSLAGFPLPPEQAWPSLWPRGQEDWLHLAPDPNVGPVTASADYFPVPGVTDSASSDRMVPWSVVPVATGGLQHLTVVEEQRLMLPPPPPPPPRRAHSSSSTRPLVPVERIWATVLALAVLESMDISWLVDEERTIVDAGREYLEAQGRADRRVRRLLRDKTLQKKAQRTIRRWQAVLSYHIGLIRGANIISAFNVLKHFQRASMRVMLAIMTQHSVLATLLDTEAVLKRWQRFMVLVTLLLTSLLTAIWFYSSRAVQCCAEVRSIINLADSVCAEGTLCRGVGADCADLLTQFADVQGPYWYSDGPGEPATEHMYLDDYQCHAFPGTVACLSFECATLRSVPLQTTPILPTRSSWASSVLLLRGPSATSFSGFSRRPTSGTTRCLRRGSSRLDSSG